MFRLSILSLFLASAFLLQGCLIGNDLSLFPIPPEHYQEVQVEEGSRNKILILDVDGVITSGGSSPDLFGALEEGTVVQVAEKLKKARDDRRVQAILLRIDSPGGSVTASDIIFKEIQKFKQEKQIPVYVTMLDTAASGGYYISMAADKVYAHPTSITGSIGVIAMFPNIAGLSEKIGVDAAIIKSGRNKDIGNFWEEMPPEHREILQNLIDQLYNRFVDAVKTGRPELSEERIRELADGRVFTAQQAHENGLIDGVMYLDEVIDQLREDTGYLDARVVIYRKTFREAIGTAYAKVTPIMPNAKEMPVSPRVTNNFGLLNLQTDGLNYPKGPFFHYLWMP